MNEWKKYKLVDICVRLSSGKGISLKDTAPVGDFPIFGGNGTRGYSHKSNFDGECAIIGRQGAYCGNVRYFKGRSYMTEHAIVLITKAEHSTRFLSYFLSLQNLGNLSAQSAQPGISVKTLSEQQYLLPRLEEQKRIAGILSSLDDKIDLLNRQNATLESMAETLFREYFIENPKEEWKDGVIADIAKHSKIAIHPQKQPTELFCHYSIPSFDNAKTPTLDLGVEIQSSKYKVPSNSILFSKLNPHKDKRVWLLLDNVEESSICSTEFQIVEPIIKEYLYFIYGWLTHSENYNDIASGVGGTSGSHQRIDTATIFSFTCPIIDLDYIRLYNSQVKPMFEKQINNQKQIRSLTKLRDTLLPKLMNNELIFINN